MRVLACWTVTLFAACATSETHSGYSDGWRGDTSTAGDTTIITTVSDSRHPRHRVDSIDLVWGPDVLERPTQLLLLGDSLLAIADRPGITLITLDGTLVKRLGSPGQGPGEFGRLGGIGLAGQAIVVVDAEAPHWTRFGRDGVLQASGTLATLPDRLINLVPGRIVIRDSSLILAWRSLGGGSQPLRLGIARHPLSGSAAQVVATLDGQRSITTTRGVLMGVELFGPSPRHAIAPDGRFAIGDGVEYCVHVGGGPQLLRLCRTWKRVPVSDAIRSPDYLAVVSESGQPMESFLPLKEALDQVIIGAHRNSFTALHFDSDNRLWVQVVDSLSADTHPVLGRFMPHQLPTHRHYDVFDSSGRLLIELLLPSSFTPWDARGPEVFGILERESGAIDVGHVRVPALDGLLP